MQKVAVLGSGKVGDVLSDGFLKNGYAVMRASRDPSKFAAWKSAAKGEAAVGTYEEAAKWGDIIVLSVKGSIADQVLDQCGVANLAGKTIIPGLIDAHAHGPQGEDEVVPQQNWSEVVNLALGTTTKHDPSARASEIFTGHVCGQGDHALPVDTIVLPDDRRILDARQVAEQRFSHAPGGHWDDAEIFKRRHARLRNLHLDLKGDAGPRLSPIVRRHEAAGGCRGGE